MKLQQRQARETGICPIREELYAQCFGTWDFAGLCWYLQPHLRPISADELIRQVTINCAERGLLLLRVRDEIRMTIAAYQTLYESSIAFGMRKALMSEQRRGEMKEEIRKLTQDRSDLQRQVAGLRAKLEDMETSEAARAASDAEKHASEVAQLQANNAALKAKLEDILSAPSKK